METVSAGDCGGDGCPGCTGCLCDSDEKAEFTNSEIRDLPWWRKDKYGWPIELYTDKPVTNFGRIVLQNLRKSFGGLF